MDLREVAYHEAGHAVAHILFGHPIEEITIKPDAGRESLGHVMSVYGGIIRGHCISDDALQMELLRQMVRGAFAGLAAQRLYNPLADPSGSDSDGWQAAALADAFCLGADPIRWKRRQAAAAGMLVRKHRVAVGAVAEALLKRQTLAPSSARKIVKRHSSHVPDELDYFHMRGEFWEQESVAELLGVSVSTLARWRRAGRGPRYLRIGPYVRYHVVPAPPGSPTLCVLDE